MAYLSIQYPIPPTAVFLLIDVKKVSCNKLFCKYSHGFHIFFPIPIFIIRYLLSYSTHHLCLMWNRKQLCISQCYTTLHLKETLLCMCFLLFRGKIRMINLCDRTCVWVLLSSSSVLAVALILNESCEDSLLSLGPLLISHSARVLSKRWSSWFWLDEPIE